ncbi:Uncharacterized conserved protein HemY, contains two TPR repeats [Noviherbaspirillum humi]|uniref:Uncharacterized conserved protein HemY, contains two TPR repeats n=1 Tax=Noviherbaspirillum humi TaxID=1688639 RepID=A0A239CM98_9BURK|nr:tetratricopeptide repeat protein [Noviherbaspirillum humi]SNS20624.1 Uncharacterized conserved protein HemY, contains two TPR repeats [Noviherbaspirillum humi]
MKNLLLIVTLPAILAACATQSPRPAASAADTAAQTASADQETSSASPSKTAARNGRTLEEKPEDPLPNLTLSKDNLYRLLAAELAAQRGDWQAAYATVVAVAQETRDPRLAKRAAEIALGAKQPAEALNAVRLWRALAPNSDEAAQYYLSFVLLGDNLAEAKPMLEQRMREAREPTRGMMAFQLQRLLSRAKDKDAAFSLLEDVLAPYQNLPESHLALAQSAFNKGDGERARSEAREALRIKPDMELAALTLAQVTADRGDADRVLADFLKRYPKSRDVRVAHARMLVEQKQYERARSEFGLLLKEQPNDLTALFALGILSAQLNDNKSAEKYLTSYVQNLSAQPDEERDPTQAYMLLAQIAEERKDSEAALRWLSQVEPGEGYLGAQIRRAQIIGKRGDLEGARAVLREIKPAGEREQIQLIIAEAQIEKDANKTPAAMQTVKDGLTRFPQSTDLLYEYAMLAEKASQYEAMETALRKVIQLAPHNQNAYNALGYSLAERNIRLPEAQSLIEKALSLAPDDPFILDSMGWVQFRLGRLKEAEASLRRAYAMRPDAEIAVHLGEVLWVKGQREDAQRFWRDAQTKDPQNDALKSTLARFNVRL